MSVRIDEKRCTACGKCVEVCTGSLLRIGEESEKKVTLPHPENCWGCASCVKECPQCALSLYLGADMGGLGGSLYVREEGYLLHWHITKPDGDTTVITVDSRDANKY